jgi:hypothetical protein
LNTLAWVARIERTGRDRLVIRWGYRMREEWGWVSAMNVSKRKIIAITAMHGVDEEI